jgi:hypothetical protein
MRSSERLRRLGIAFLVLPLAASCQSASKTSYSGTIERTAAEIEAEVTQRLCTALTPIRVNRADYDASPAGIQDALARGAAAWAVTCQP